jgi:hypothetical protein
MVHRAPAAGVFASSPGRSLPGEGRPGAGATSPSFRGFFEIAIEAGHRILQGWKIPGEGRL